MWNLVQKSFNKMRLKTFSVKATNYVVAKRVYIPRYQELQCHLMQITYFGTLQVCWLRRVGPPFTIATTTIPSPHWSQTLFQQFRVNGTCFTVLEFSDHMESEHISCKVVSLRPRKKSSFEVPGKFVFLPVSIFRV